jgi:hypothetical protein
MGALKPWHMAVLGCVCVVTVLAVAGIALIAAQRSRR